MSQSSITALYQELEKARAACKAIPDEQEKRLQHSLREAVVIGHRILKLRTADAHEMLLKIRVGLWMAGIDPRGGLEDLDHWRPGPRLNREAEHELLASLRDDLLAA